VQVRRWGGQLVIGVIIGIVLGFFIGWGLWPREPSLASPADLRWDYQEHYIIMVATAYEGDGDLDLARQRLAELDPEYPATPVVRLGERLVAAGASGEDITRLAHLARAMNAITPPLLPYLEEQP
jgi:hypothetical protein